VLHFFASAAFCFFSFAASVAPSMANTNFSLALYQASSAVDDRSNIL
jgi:hypothetical protein